MHTGVLKTAFSDKGFTFIVPGPDAAMSEDVFLHVSHLASGEDAARYVRGAQVQYEVALVLKNGVEKPQARAVRLVTDGSTDVALASVVQKGRTGYLKFWSPLGFGFLVDEQAGEDVYVKTADVPGGYLRNGDCVQFDMERGNQKPRAVNVRVVSWSPTKDPYTDQLDMGLPLWAQQLAELAENESWNYEESPQKDKFVVLRSYVKHTFLRLNELPNHVITAADGSTLAFNTGLVTSYQEDLFAVFRRRSPDKLGPPWRIKGFEKASSVPFLQQFGGQLPPLATYYDDPAQLVYDTSVPLHVSVEHVPHDPERFPESLKSLSPQDLSALVNAKAPEAVHRVRRNYKTAIPQFYRDSRTGSGKMQLLLPVALLRRDTVELALAVDRLEHTYLGRTVLTLDWAYNNARLITRPDRDWLRP